MGSCELFARAGLEPPFSRSQLPKKLGLQAWASGTQPGVWFCFLNGKRFAWMPCQRRFMDGMTARGQCGFSCSVTGRCSPWPHGQSHSPRVPASGPPLPRAPQLVPCASVLSGSSPGCCGPHWLSTHFNAWNDISFLGLFSEELNLRALVKCISRKAKFIKRSNFAGGH
jgi:hypothetical protein